MEKEKVFEAWAPRGGVWSPWAKPVLFSFLPRPLSGPAPPAAPPTEAIRAPDERLARAPDAPRPHFPTQGMPPPEEGQALVVEMPGPLAVMAGLAVAEMGYRPVPLFNACPPPWAEGGVGFAPAAVDVDSILAALMRGAERLRALALPADAPPAFLVDSDRQAPRIPFRPGVFDNRSVLFPTDFPSAAFLTSHGIQGAVLLRPREQPVAWDLARALRPWRSAGLPLREWCLDQPGTPAPLALPRLWFLTEWGKRLWALLSLRPNPMGGYGGLVTEASGG
jgi:hypothetical protein